MEVANYVFQSRYPSSFQVGRLDPQTVPKEDKADFADSVSQVEKKSVKTAQNNISQASTSSSVNLSQSFNSSALSNSLENFTAINNQIKAIQAYSS